MTRKRDKYGIAAEFSKGFCAALVPEPCDDAKSDHWQAGWIAGYSVKKEKNRLLNIYLVSIGQEPMAVVVLARKAEGGEAPARKEPSPGAKVIAQCQAGNDGECVHKSCPQLRDNEPLKTGRHCPLDVLSDDD